MSVFHNLSHEEGVMKSAIFFLVFFFGFNEANAFSSEEIGTGTSLISDEIIFSYSFLPLDAHVNTRYENATGELTKEISTAHLVKISGGATFISPQENRKIVRLGVSIGFIWPEKHSFSDFFSLYIDGSSAIFLSPSGSPIDLYVGCGAGFMNLQQKVIPGIYSRYTDDLEPRIVSTAFFIQPFAGLEIRMSRKIGVAGNIGYICSTNFYDWKFAENGKEKSSAYPEDAEYDKMKIRGIAPSLNLIIHLR